MKKSKLYILEVSARKSSLMAVSMSPSDPQGLLDDYVSFSKFGEVR